MTSSGAFAIQFERAAALRWRKSMGASAAAKCAQENLMPIYEYVCEKCATEFEALVRSDTVPECPACHSPELKKVLSVFATGSSTPERAPVAAGPCGSCGHPGGPGACAFQ
jgi:putative FmdB family regulatory protein